MKQKLNLPDQMSTRCGWHSWSEVQVNMNTKVQTRRLEAHIFFAMFAPLFGSMISLSNPFWRYSSAMYTNNNTYQLWYDTINGYMGKRPIRDYLLTY